MPRSLLYLSAYSLQTMRHWAWVGELTIPRRLGSQFLNTWLIVRHDSENAHLEGIVIKPKLRN